MAIKISFTSQRKYCSKSLFGWTISINNSRGRRIHEDVNGVLTLLVLDFYKIILVEKF